MAKPITSELGGVSPIIIVPSDWTKRDLRYQAEHVVTQRLHDGGYNCIAGQVVVVSTDWPQKKRSSPNSDGHLRSPLNAAVALAHDEFVGTLGANLIVDPKVIRQLGTGVLDAIARLRYGTIAINAWTGLGFLTATASWGALPGATVDNVQSGIGTVHNALLIDRPERTIVRGPFRPFPRSFAHGEFPLFPKPPWFVQARSAATAGRRLAGFAAGPSWLKMPAIFLAAFRA